MRLADKYLSLPESFPQYTSLYDPNGQEPIIGDYNSYLRARERRMEILTLTQAHKRRRLPIVHERPERRFGL
jgi:hypothetical protein